MKLKALLGVFCLFCVSGFVHASIEEGNSAKRVIVDGGNDWLPISVPVSTNAPVIISTTPQGSNVLSPDILQTWRFREIINISTCANLVLYPSSGTYNSYQSSFSVVLGSDTTGGGLGDSYIVPHQGAVWGLWSQGCGEGGPGAGGEVTFYNPKKDKLPDGQK